MMTKQEVLREHEFQEWVVSKQVPTKVWGVTRSAFYTGWMSGFADRDDYADVFKLAALLVGIVIGMGLGWLAWHK